MKALKLINESKNHMKDKELLLEAIDNYDLFTKNTQIVLKTLIEIAIDNVIIASVVRLSQLAQVSRPAVYSALKVLEDNGIIEKTEMSGKKLTSFILKPMKLNDIIKFYTPRKNLLQK